jgi:hypothetical protein
VTAAAAAPAAPAAQAAGEKTYVYGDDEWLKMLKRTEKYHQVA